MKFKGLAIATVALAALCAGPVLAQVTMQPIPNPPEKAKAPTAHAHKGKHHHKHKAEKKADESAASK